eukprot:6020313-Amphidinium_carterae.1
MSPEINTSGSLIWRDIMAHAIPQLKQSWKMWRCGMAPIGVCMCMRVPGGHFITKLPVGFRRCPPPGADG